MESSRLILAAALAPALAAAWLESRSPACARLRAQLPLTATAGDFFLSYDPAASTLDVSYGGPARPADHALPAPALPEGEDPPLELKLWLTENNRPLKFWGKLAALLRADLPVPLFDRLALALELHRLRPDDVRPAYGPSAPPGGEPPAEPVAEILNASSRKGLASEAGKVLRSRQVDVVSFGNAPPRRRTVVYDRTGRFETAARVARMLGCGAQPVTRVDPSRLVDVTVILSEDCELSPSRGLKWN